MFIIIIIISSSSSSSSCCCSIIITLWRFTCAISANPVRRRGGGGRSQI